MTWVRTANANFAQNAGFSELGKTWHILFTQTAHTGCEQRPFFWMLDTSASIPMHWSGRLQIASAIIDPAMALHPAPQSGTTVPKHATGYMHGKIRSQLPEKRTEKLPW